LKNDQIVQLIETVPFFNKFTKSEKQELAGLKNLLLRYQSLHYIIREGAYDPSFFILLKGNVRITKGQPEVVIAKLKTGAVFGELSWISNRPRSTNVVAEGDVIVMRINQESLEKVSQSLQNQMRNHVIDLLVSRLEATNEQLARLSKQIETGNDR
jgi:CRP-like cAMP-binding protein